METLTSSRSGLLKKLIWLTILKAKDPSGEPSDHQYIYGHDGAWLGIALLDPEDDGFFIHLFTFFLPLNSGLSWYNTYILISSCWLTILQSAFQNQWAAPQ